MKKGEAVQLYVQLDTADVQSAAEKLAETLDSMGQSLDTIAQWDMRDVAESLDMLVDKISTLSEELGTLQISDSTIGNITEISDMISSLLAVLEAVCGEDVVKELLPALGTFLTKTLPQLLGKAFEWIGAIFGGASLGTIALIAAAIILTIASIVKNFDAIKTRFNELWEEHIKPLWDRIMEFGNSMATIWDTVIVPVAEWIYQVLGPLFTAAVFGVIEAVGVVLEVICLVVTGIIDIVDGVIQAVVAVFEGDWDKLGENLWKIICGVFEIIGGCFVFIGRSLEWAGQLLAGALMAVIVGAVNLIGGILKVLGNIFGQDWGWHWEIPASVYIPKLAQGAVLPANKPFLAMVGDQRHGTNVEAPLATIQEAVAQVMENQFSGMMAGFEASVAVQKQILQAVLGIEVGDTVIGQAANRYNRRMAIIKGGM